MRAGLLRRRSRPASLIDEIVREGARRMLAAALEAEVAAYIAAHRDELDEQGRRLVVRNGRAQPRQVLTSAGAVEVVAPRVNDKRVDEATGERRRFASAILPAWCRKSPKITEVLPLLYLHGLSSKDFVPALESFLGTGSGLSAAVVTRLTGQWQDEAHAFGNRQLSDVDYVYLWADGVHLNIRLDEEKLCLLVMIGVRVDGSKELVALAEGYRESAGSWADLLRDCKRRGMRASTLAVGDGALGFWAALREVFPDTREQRCWFHKIGNVLAALPKSAHPGAKKALAQIWNAEDRDHARRAVAAFKLAYGGKFGKAVDKITGDLDELLAFYDFPAEHWIHLRTTNPIESTFATVRHRTKVTKGPGSKAAGLAMAYKLIEAARPGGGRSTHPTSWRWSAPAPPSARGDSSSVQATRSPHDTGRPSAPVAHRQTDRAAAGPAPGHRGTSLRAGQASLHRHPPPGDCRRP
jgi:transposase-like protein